MTFGFILSMVACASTEQATARALTAAEYERALDVCTQLASRERDEKAAGEAFDLCAADIDHRWCKTRGLRCRGE